MAFVSCMAFLSCLAFVSCVLSDLSSLSDPSFLSCLCCMLGLYLLFDLCFLIVLSCAQLSCSVCFVSTFGQSFPPCTSWSLSNFVGNTNNVVLDAIIADDLPALFVLFCSHASTSVVIIPLGNRSLKPGTSQRYRP
jgi:hypothetical protein